MTMTVECAMRIAIAQAKAGAKEGHRPFGCVIADMTPGLAVVKSILAVTNGTGPDHDPTQHSEITAIAEACGRRGGLLHNCLLVSTHEPCHMCCGAIKHSKAGAVVWGSERSDLPQLFRQNRVSAKELLADTTRPPAMEAGVMRGECVALFAAELALENDRGR